MIHFIRTIVTLVLIGITGFGINILLLAHTRITEWADNAHFMDSMSAAVVKDYIQLYNQLNIIVIAASVGAILIAIWIYHDTVIQGGSIISPPLPPQVTPPPSTTTPRRH